MRRLASIAAVAICLTAVLAPTGRSETLTTCAFGGPTPGFKAIRFDLPEGTDYIGIDPHGSRPLRPASSEENWHLAQGLVVVNTDDLALESYRVESTGTFPRRAVVSTEGTADVRQSLPGPDGPFFHIAQRPRAGLPPGSYYVIGFGTDGGRTLPNEWWGFDFRILGKHACTPVGSGEVFDVDHTEFEGGTQVYAGVAGHAEGLSHSLETPRRIVVGLQDAGVQGAGDAVLDHAAPNGTSTIEDEIVAFSSVGGTHSFTGSYSGPFPLLLVAGVAVDLP